MVSWLLTKLRNIYFVGGYKVGYLDGYQDGRREAFNHMSARLDQELEAYNK